MSGRSTRILPAAATGRPRRTGGRLLAAVVLTLGVGGCADVAGPVAPSPGITSGPAVGGTSQQSTTPTTSPAGADTKPGIRLAAVPRADGSFDVTEDVLLPEATDILQLQVPPSGDQLPGMMAATKPVATQLRVVADGTAVRVESTTVTATTSLPLLRSATRVRLTYRLSGSAVLSRRAETTRSGAAVRPLSATAESTLPTDFTVTGGLLNAICPLLTEPRCAAGDPPNLTIRQDLPAAEALVVLQLDLPR